MEKKEIKKLRDCVPHEFFKEFTDTRAFKMLDVEVVETVKNKPWIGTHKNVYVWWRLANGYAVAWNENPSIGWSFPVVKIKSQ